MKRHPSLIPFSRQHHEGLLTARLLQLDAPPYKGLPQDTEGKKQYFLDFYRLHLNPHLQLEERVLFPYVQGREPELDQLLAELKDEHQQLHSLTAELRYDKDMPAKLDAVGKLLEAHIRKEERVFFERLQTTLSEEDLQELNRQVELALPYLNQPPYIT